MKIQGYDKKKGKGDNTAKNINNWDVKNVTDMSGTFLKSSFNQVINNWNVIEGSVYTGTVGAYGTPIIQDPNHWLAQNIDWGSVPVGTQAVEFMRNIIIDDPDATVIVSLNHASYGEVPLLVEKNYGEGTIILFNCP